MIRAAFLLMLAVLPLAAATKDPAKLIAAVAKGLVQVEFVLQFDKGDAPHGILDQDPRSSGARFNTLADLVSEERPLETSGYLVSADRVVAMDPCVHPRFIREIVVRQGEVRSRARVAGYYVDQWALVLALEKPLAGAIPLKFAPRGSENPAGLVNYYRQDGQMTRVLLPFGGQFIETPEGQRYRVTEHQGVAISGEGRPLGLVMNHRLEPNHSWRGDPLAWRMLKPEEFSATLKDLETLTAQTLVRVRLSFRSPKATPGQSQGGRFRGRGGDDSDEDNSTERDALGVVLAGGRVAVLATLKPSQTARLERMTVFEGTPEGVPARFVATLRDFGVMVVETSKPLPVSLEMDAVHPADLLGRLLFRAEVDLQGETRATYFHLARIAGVRVGARLEPYPEISDPEVKDTFLFTRDRRLYALPVTRRDHGASAREGAGSQRQLTTGRLIQDAVRRLPETADLANVPVSESEENRLAWLGVEMQPLSRELARANNASDQTRDGQSGGLITYVHAGSPAAKAGIQPGMILLRVRSPLQPLPIEVQLEEDFARAQGFPWERLDEIRDQFFERIPTPWPPAETSFTRALTDLGFGTRFTAEFLNDGRLQTKEFTVEAGPAHYEAATRFKSESLGITVRNLTYDVRRYIQRPASEPGVVVSRIEPGSRSSVAGVKPYELVTHVDEQPVNSVADFEKLTAGNADLKLTIKRMSKGRIVTIKALLGEKKE
jgi:hypothetical protein